MDLLPSDDVLNHFHPMRVIVVGVIRKSSPMTIGSGTPSPPQWAILKKLQEVRNISIIFTADLENIKRNEFFPLLQVLKRSFTTKTIRAYVACV